MISLRWPVKWIVLHTAACKCSRLLGRKLTKQKNVNWVFFLFFIFGDFLVLTSGLAWHRKPTWERGSKGSAGVCGRIWGTTELTHSPEQWSRAGARCRGRGSVSPPAHYTAAFLSFTGFSLLSSTGIVTWGTYWKFWLAQIWNRSPIFSSILKVSFFFKVIAPLSRYRSHEYLTITLSTLQLFKSFHPPLIFYSTFFPAAKESNLPLELLRFPSTCLFHAGMCAEYQSGAELQQSPLLKYKAVKFSCCVA